MQSCVQNIATVHYLQLLDLYEPA